LLDWRQRVTQLCPRELLPSFSCFLDTVADTRFSQSLLFSQLKSRSLKALDILLRHPSSVASFLDGGLLPALIHMAQPSALRTESASLDKLEEKALFLDEQCYEFGTGVVDAANVALEARAAVVSADE